LHKGENEASELSEQSAPVDIINLELLRRGLPPPGLLFDLTSEEERRMDYNHTAVHYESIAI
jgi:hypothetical protein